MGVTQNLTKDYDGDDLYPSWSRDGKLIAFWSSREGGGYFTISPRGGRVENVATLNSRNPVQPGPPQWSPDCSKLAFVVYDSLDYRIGIFSLKGDKRTIKLPKTINHPPGWELTWSPDGHFFAYVTMWTYATALSPLYIVRVQDNSVFRVTDAKYLDKSPSFSKDGRTLFSFQIVVVVWIYGRCGSTRMERQKSNHNKSLLVLR